MNSNKERKLKAPNRFSPQIQHNKYGIEKWLKASFISDKELKKLLITEFLAFHKFEAKGKNKDLSLENPSVAAFIQNRFNAFASFCCRRTRQLAPTTEPAVSPAKMTEQ